MKNAKKRLKRILKYPVNKTRSIVLATNYYMGNYNKVVWLVGDGRSGTTWVSDLINYDKSYREMFEPFHPTLVKSMECFSLHQYIRPDQTEQHFLSIASDVFSGKFRDDRVDKANWRLFYKGLLIKDIFANLFIAWVTNHFPHIKIVFLIRNPFAVALSKYKKKNWSWMTDPRDFLHQEALYNDYLKPFEEIIINAGDDYIDRQVLIWAIIHYIPFLQLKRDQVYILFYENLYNSPSQELAKLFHYLEINTNVENRKVLNILNTPTRVTDEKNNIDKGKSPINQWQKELSVKNLDNGLKILRHFGLDQIYGDDSMPRSDIVEKLLMRS